MQRFFQQRRLSRDVRNEVSKEKELASHSGSTLRLASPILTTHQENSLGSKIGENLANRLDNINPDEYDISGQPKVFIVQGGSVACSPRYWSTSRRTINTLCTFGIVFACGWTSAADSDINRSAAEGFHVTREVETLATAMFLFGNALGALFAGPISETIGRSASYLAFMFVYLIMVLITSLSPNFTVQIIFRFLAGLFGSPPMTIYGGSLADLYSNAERSLVWPLFALSPILGPLLAPVAGGWLMQPSWISWRWVDWTALIISSVVFLLAFLFLGETYSPILLKWRAANLRDDTGDTRFQSAHDVGEPLLQRLVTNASRPIIFFTKEPIVITIGLYLTLIWVLVFTFLDGFTFIFINTHEFSRGLRGSAFLAIVVGVLLNTATMPLVRSNYLAHLAQAASEQETEESSDEEAVLPPEIRLLPAVLCAPLLPISLLWLGWTNYRSISPWSNLIAAGVFGFSLMGIFVSSYQYIIDAYETNSASALSSITFLRYGAAGGMAMATMPMYNSMGVHWTMTLMGCLGFLMVPVPFYLWKYGHKVRARSGYARNF